MRLTTWRLAILGIVATIIMMFLSNAIPKNPRRISKERIEIFISTNLTKLAIPKTSFKVLAEVKSTPKPNEALAHFGMQHRLHDAVSKKMNTKGNLTVTVIGASVTHGGYMKV